MPECLLKLLTVWLERTSPPPTWNILIEALESPPVGEGHLAQQLRDKYCQKGRGEGNHALCALPTFFYRFVSLFMASLPVSASGRSRWGSVGFMEPPF